MNLWPLEQRLVRSDGYIDTHKEHSTMAYLVSLLPALACPVLMGLMMWLMMCGNKDHGGEQAQQMDVRSPSNPMNAPQKRSMVGFHICLNWKVVAGLAGVESVNVFLASEKAVIRLDPARVNLTLCERALDRRSGRAADQCQYATVKIGNAAG